MYLSIDRSIHLSIYLFISACLSIYLSICMLGNEALLQDFLIFPSWQHQKRSNSARLLQFLNLTTSKTKQFCETSSIFELDNIKNKAILRDFFQKWKVEWRADGLVPVRFAIFPLHLSQVLRLPRKNWRQVIRSAASVTQNHLSKPTDLMLQNATLLRKSAPWPPNISDEHVFCTAPATENASLPHALLTFDNVHNPLRLPRKNYIWSFKTGEAVDAQFCKTSSIIFELNNVKNETILRDFFIFWTWQHPKRSNSARLLQFLNLTTSKTQQFCETSFKNGKLSAALTASYQCVCDFSTPPV